MKDILREKPLIYIGKKGLHKNLIKEILHLVEKRKIIKIRVLKNLLQAYNIDRKTFFKELEEKLKNYKIEIKDIRGYTAILYKS